MKRTQLWIWDSWKQRGKHKEAALQKSTAGASRSNQNLKKKSTQPNKTKTNPRMMHRNIAAKEKKTQLINTQGLHTLRNKKKAKEMSFWPFQSEQQPACQWCNSRKQEGHCMIWSVFTCQRAEQALCCTKPTLHVTLRCFLDLSKRKKKKTRTEVWNGREERSRRQWWKLHHESCPSSTYATGRKARFMF